MIDRHTQLEAMRRDIAASKGAALRRDIATSTDPQWHRDRFGIHQYSPIQIVGLATIGLIMVLAFSVVW